MGEMKGIVKDQNDIANFENKNEQLEMKNK
jgi:hypothetical protein